MKQKLMLSQQFQLPLAKFCSGTNRSLPSGVYFQLSKLKFWPCDPFSVTENFMGHFQQLLCLSIALFLGCAGDNGCFSANMGHQHRLLHCSCTEHVGWDPSKVPGCHFEKYNPKWNSISSTQSNYEMQDAWFFQDTVLRTEGQDLNLSKMVPNFWFSFVLRPPLQLILAVTIVIAHIFTHTLFSTERQTFTELFFKKKFSIEERPEALDNIFFKLSN